MGNVFYGIVDETGNLLHYVDFRGVLVCQSYAIFDVAPSMATFFNTEGEALDLAIKLTLEHENKDFSLRTFNY